MGQVREPVAVLVGGPYLDIICHPERLPARFHQACTAVQQCGRALRHVHQHVHHVQHQRLTTWCGGGEEEAGQAAEIRYGVLAPKEASSMSHVSA